MTRKHLHILTSLMALAAGAVTLTSCGALWSSSVEVGGSPDDYYYGWNGEMLPPLAGTPVVSPYYYGGTSYPVSVWHPVHRPGYGPWGNPVAPDRPPVITVPNRPVGNQRPGQGSRPSQGNATVVPSTPIPLGSNPGIQLPPEGSGMKYTPPTNGRH